MSLTDLYLAHIAEDLSPKDLNSDLDSFLGTIGSTISAKCKSFSSCVPLGPNTRALMALSDPKRTIMAFGTYGLGKWVFLGHPDYLTCLNDQDNAYQLREGVTSLLGIQNEIKSIDHVKKLDTQKLPKIVSWNGNIEKRSPSFVDDMLGYVESGGKLVCGFCSRDWKKSLMESSCVQLFAQFGLLLNDFVFSPDRNLKLIEVDRELLRNIHFVLNAIKVQNDLLPDSFYGLVDAVLVKLSPSPKLIEVFKPVAMRLSEMCSKMAPPTDKYHDFYMLLNRLLFLVEKCPVPVKQGPPLVCYMLFSIGLGFCKFKYTIKHMLLFSNMVGTFCLVAQENVIQPESTFLVTTE
ncbi:hypothetical protein ACOME3_007254 [Neoechinorhynchus agilis]